MSRRTFSFETTLRHPHINASLAISGLSVNIMIGRSGLIRDNSRAASSPFITGIERSRRTKSGLRARDLVDCLAPVAGFAANNPIGNTFKYVLDGVQHAGAVIYNQNALRHSFEIAPSLPMAVNPADTVARGQAKYSSQDSATARHRSLTGLTGFSPAPGHAVTSELASWLHIS